MMPTCKFCHQPPTADDPFVQGYEWHQSCAMAFFGQTPPKPQADTFWDAFVNETKTRADTAHWFGGQPYKAIWRPKVEPYPEKKNPTRVIPDKYTYRGTMKFPSKEELNKFLRALGVAEEDLD